MSDSPLPSWRRKLLALGLLLVLAGAVAAYHSRQQLLQNLLRPLLAGELSRRLQIELTIGRLDFADGLLQAEQLSIGIPGRGRLELAGLECQLDWSTLRDHRLPRLLLIRPRIVLLPTEPAASSTTIAWPKVPPWAVADLEIRDGSISFPGHAVPTWRFAGRGRLETRWELELQLQTADSDPQRLDLQAHGRWDGAIRAELTNLAWQGRRLLGAPLRLALQDGVVVELAGKLELAALSHLEVSALAAAFGRPLPQVGPWRIERLRLQPQLDDRGLRLEASLASLWVGKDPARPLLRQIALTVQGTPGEQLKFTAESQLGPAADPLVLVGQWLRGDPPALVLQRLDWRQQALLAEPLQLSLTDSPRGSATLQLARLDRPALQSLLDLANLHLPTFPDWQLHDLRLESGWDGDQLDLQLTSGTGTLQAADRKLHMDRARFSASGRRGQWQLDGSADFGAGSRLLARIELREERLHGRATLEVPELASFGQDQAGLRLPPLVGSLRLAGDFAGSAGQPILALSAAVQGQVLSGVAGMPNLDLAANATVLRRREGWRLEDGSLTGSLTGDWAGSLTGGLTGRLDSGDWVLQLIDLHGEKLAWTDPDGLSAYAGGRLRLNGSLSQATDAPLGFDFYGELSGGELLHGSYYASLAEVNSRFALQGMIAASSLHLAQGLLEIPQVGELHLQGVLAAPDHQFEATLELPDLQQMLDGPGRQLFGESFPQLDQATLSGALRIEAAATRRPDAWSLQLRIEPRQATLGWGNQLRVNGLQGGLPLLFGSYEEPADLPGRLAWTRLTLGPLGSGPGQLTTRARPGELQFTDELRLEIASGVLRLAEVALLLPPGAPELTGRLSVSGVELQDLTRALDWPEMRGELSADLGHLYLRQGELGTGGTAEIDVFNGHISLTGLRLREVFSRYPEFHADIDFRGIDLYQLTNTFEFGEMNGVIDGHIHQLRLFGGTPTRFEAALKTRPGGTRNISVKALNNLTILSQGGLSAALSRGIYQFIDFYRYRSIGVECSLENDLFRMRGTALAGSDRYLVHGSWLPPRIDIISSSPAVSFKEMVRRIKRIERPAGSAAGH